MWCERDDLRKIVYEYCRGMNMNILEPKFQRDIHALLQEGKNYSEISRILGIAKDTVRRYGRTSGWKINRGPYAKPFK